MFRNHSWYNSQYSNAFEHFLILFYITYLLIQINKRCFDFLNWDVYIKVLFLLFLNILTFIAGNSVLLKQLLRLNWNNSIKLPVLGGSACVCVLPTSSCVTIKVYWFKKKLLFVLSWFCHPHMSMMLPIRPIFKYYFWFHPSWLFIVFLIDRLV